MTETLREAYRVMRTIRAFEERVGEEYAGEEASAVGVCLHLDDRDVIAGSHRGHGHRIAKGADVRAVMADVRGHRASGRPFGGKDGVPLLVCGTAIAAKQQDNGGVGVAFFGDGDHGAVLDALNLASVWSLPAIFVAENAGYADRVGGSGVPGVLVDGADFFAVHEAAGEAIDRARGGGGPTLIEVEPLPSQRQDCLELFRARVVDSGELTAADFDEIDAAVARLIEDSVCAVKAAPNPARPDLETAVYVSY